MSLTVMVGAACSAACMSTIPAKKAIVPKRMSADFFIDRPLLDGLPLMAKTVSMILMQI
jgi:hypothetical protein